MYKYLALSIFIYAVLVPVHGIDLKTQMDNIAAFSSPSEIWGKGIESLIEEAYRTFFKTRIIGSRIMNIRMPFSENNERRALSDIKWRLFEGGKGSPDKLWPVIEKALDSDDFALYVKTLSDGREQVIIFDMAKQSWRSSRELSDIANMKAGIYHGLPHRPRFYVSGKGIEEADVYNYLYCIGLTGMDCSAFVWHTLSFVASRQGINLGRTLSRTLGVPRSGNPAHYAGTSFFGSRSSHIIQVPDRIKNLRPADIILFRGPKGVMAHSAIIQSIDFKQGIIRYLQCTDEAPLHERGVHESFIYFNPDKPDISLRSLELRWTQRRQAPFPGERSSAFPDDGRRYRAYQELGGSKIVRLRVLSPR